MNWGDPSPGEGGRAVAHPAPRAGPGRVYDPRALQLPPARPHQGGWAEGAAHRRSTSARSSASGGSCRSASRGEGGGGVARGSGEGARGGEGGATWGSWSGGLSLGRGLNSGTRSKSKSKSTSKGSAGLKRSGSKGLGRTKAKSGDTEGEGGVREGARKVAQNGNHNSGTGRK